MKPLFQHQIETMITSHPGPGSSTLKEACSLSNTSCIENQYHSPQCHTYSRANLNRDTPPILEPQPTKLPTWFIVAAILAALVPASSSNASPDSDFQNRCGGSGVVKCVGFDSATDISGTYGDNHGILPGETTPGIDTTVKASGAGSLKFTIPSNSGANTSGSYFTNFSNDLSIQFGENSDFYVQWRQKFSPEFLSTKYSGSNGWKQAAITTGDQPGKLYASCEALGVTMQNTYQRGFAQMYQSCTGSTSHGAYDPFEQYVVLPSGDDILLQNARPAPYCTYLQGKTSPPSFFPPTGNCLAYFPNEWMTFQVHIHTGPRVNDELTNSHVDVWIAREGKPAQAAFNWGPYNLSAGSPAEDQKYGKVWFLPYQTNKDSTQVTPIAYTWYDELIISRTRIPDPQSTADSIPPAPPAGLRVQ